MKILVIGSGGREHAILAALKKSARKPELFAAPGNGGISEIARCFDVKAADTDGVVGLAREIGADWVFVAPDDPLVLGAVDALNAAGFKTFGPSKAAAVLEGSKVFSKGFMKRHNIPTAEYETFGDPDAALDFIKTREFPIVIKCDGLALGKGVIIAQNLAEAVEAVDSIMRGGKFGDSGREIVVEEFLDGREVTVLAFTDGTSVKPMPASVDHKRALDGDRGLNTGGMGTVTPVPYYTPEIAAECAEKIFLPTVRGMAAENRVFKGCLYFGLMLTKGGVKVIEYNSRFGDPEAQVILPLLETDLIDIMEAVWEERLSELDIVFAEKAAACVVMASGGYPEKYAVGLPISGLGRASEIGEDIIVYHAGTRVSGDGFVTSGGRVLGVTAVADGLSSALAKAYEAVGGIGFGGAHYRKDIGKRIICPISE